MKYLCLGYFDPAKMDALSRAQVDTVMGECPAHMETLYQSGRVALVAGVDAEATYLRRVGGEMEAANGLTAASQAKVGCVFLIEAADMADAVRIASLHPTTQVAAGEHLGWYTEIRPVHSFQEGS